MQNILQATPDFLLSQPTAKLPSLLEMSLIVKFIRQQNSATVVIITIIIIIIIRKQKSSYNSGILLTIHRRSDHPNYFTRIDW